MPHTSPKNRARTRARYSGETYQQALEGLRDPHPVNGLLEALARRYEREYRDCSLLWFDESGATCLFDSASAVGAARQDRNVAAGWTVRPAIVGKRNVRYQRGFPLLPDPDGTLVDRGHLIPHLYGGEFGPYIFRQDRALNRGWSEDGRRYRALKREAAATPGTSYFEHLLYEDDSAYPAVIETWLLRSGTLHIERFRNRPPTQQTASRR